MIVQTASQYSPRSSDFWCEIRTWSCQTGATITDGEDKNWGLWQITYSK